MSRRSNFISRDSYRILAEGCYQSNDTWKTGINNNDLIIGPSGAGKTRNYVKPNLMQCSESIIVGDTKGTLYREVAPVLRENGYEVLLVDFTDLPKSTCSYNPLDYIRKTGDRYSEQDIITIASAIVSDENPSDPFWHLAAQQYLAAMIAFVMEALPEEEHTLEYVYKVFQLFGKPCYEEMLNQLQDEQPDSIAVKRFNAVSRNRTAEKMDASIMGILSQALDRISLEEAFEMYRKPNRLNFRQLGRQKTALFLSTSDTDHSMDKLVNLLFTQALHVLCTFADKCDHGRLPVPVRMYMDDFAANVIIPDFDKLISIIRSRDISVSVILQSLSQLQGIYGQARASTIINNCDNWLYLGGQDSETAEYIAAKLDRTAHTILTLPLESAYLFTRGSQPREAKKYNVAAHPRYAQLKGEVSRQEQTENASGKQLPEPREALESA